MIELEDTPRGNTIIRVDDEKNCPFAHKQQCSLLQESCKKASGMFNDCPLYSRGTILVVWY